MVVILFESVLCENKHTSCIYQRISNGLHGVTDLSIELKGRVSSSSHTPDRHGTGEYCGH